MSRTGLTLLVALAACGRQDAAKTGRAPTAFRDSTDSVYALVQQRGRGAMGVDQYTSSHKFEPLRDGGRITLERDPSDTAGVAQIRKHMQEIGAAFRAGSFAVPGFVHDREVPGTEVMSAKRTLISYIPEGTPAGGQLRIVTRDSAAVTAIHQFLAFQRRDHRVGHNGDGH